MTPQKPAMGIAQTNDFHNSKYYRVECSCGADHDAINFEVEADPELRHVTVHTWTEQRTDCWSFRNGIEYNVNRDPLLEDLNIRLRTFWNTVKLRARLTWDIWVHGYARYDSWTIMNAQQALNYSETLKTAAQEVTAAVTPRRRKTTKTT